MTWRKVAPVEAAARANPWLAVDVDGLPLALASVGGAWYAVEDRCTHAGCPFSSEATIEDGRLVCNCHGSEFVLATGDVLRGPAEYPVRTVPARMGEGGIEVDL